MRFMAGGAVVVVGCACAALAAGEGGARDYVAERAALVASVIPPSEGAEQGWESLASAIRAVSISRQRIVESLRLRHGLGEGVALEIDPLVLIGAPEEEEAQDPGEGARAEDADGDGAGVDVGEEGAGGEGEAGGPVDVEAIALGGARALMRTYEGNRIYDRLTALRVKPRVAIPLDEKPLMVRDFSYADGLRLLSRLEAVRMWRFLEAGEEKRAADSFEALLALGVVLSREPTFVGRLQSIAVVGTATGTLERWMLEHRLDDELARDLLSRLERHAGRLTALSYTLAGERLTGLDTIARVFAREIPAPMVMEEGEAGKLKSQEENERRLNELYDAVEAWAALPAHERREASPSPVGVAESMPEGLVLVKVLAPGLEQGVWWGEVGRVDVDGARLMLALEVSRAEAGTYPESLEALVPAVLGELPRDGYAPDGRYRYRRVEGGGSRAGGAYVLYSVGSDGEDDGGEAAARGHALSALWPSGEGKGADYVVNRRDRE